jgi:hypothetical protein
MWGLSYPAGNAHPKRYVTKSHQIAVLHIGAVDGTIVEVGVVYGAQILEHELVALPGQLALLPRHVRARDL